jgi:hypothetical protein
MFIGLQCVRAFVFFSVFFFLSLLQRNSHWQHTFGCVNVTIVKMLFLWRFNNWASSYFLENSYYCCWLCFSLPTIILVFSSHFSFFKPKNFVKISVGNFCFLFQNLIIWLSFWKKFQSLQDYQNWKRNPSCGRVKKIKLLLRSARRK